MCSCRKSRPDLPTSTSNIFYNTMLFNFTQLKEAGYHHTLSEKELEARVQSENFCRSQLPILQRCERMFAADVDPKLCRNAYSLFK